jgi:predicted protein tyrosine phosphatase
MQGARTAQAIVKEAQYQLQRMANVRLKGASTVCVQQPYMYTYIAVCDIALYNAHNTRFPLQ